jgi:predicted nucleotide-binding protein (sugar kinase/HSP70/actin superfamily)
MVLSTGKSIYMYEKGADGIIDISPFSCMNGIVTQAIYPVVQRELDGLPIRVFYFDGTQADLERDVGIFIELARTYQRRKKKARRYPAYFGA